MVRSGWQPPHPASGLAFRDMTGRFIQKPSVLSAWSPAHNAIDRTRVRRRSGRRSRRRRSSAGHGQAVLARACLPSLPNTRRSRLLRVIFSNFRSRAFSAWSRANPASTTVGISATMTRYPPPTTGDILGGSGCPRQTDGPATYAPAGVDPFGVVLRSRPTGGFSYDSAPRPSACDATMHGQRLRRPGHDPGPLVWYFFIERTYEKSWS